MCLYTPHACMHVCAIQVYLAMHDMCIKSLSWQISFFKQCYTAQGAAKNNHKGLAISLTCN